MRVLFGVQQTAASPGTRYRVLQYLPRFAAAGLQGDLLTAQSEATTRASIGSVHMSPVVRVAHLALVWLETQVFLVRLVAALPRYDRGYLYRIPIAAWAVPLLRRHRARLIYDFDDALDAPERPGTIARLRWRIWSAGLRRAIQCCAVIVTSNERNAEAVRARGGRAVVAVPTAVDVERYRGDQTSAGRPTPLRIGWIGTPSTAPYLAAIEAPLADLVRERAVEIVLVGAGTSPFRALPATLIPWRLEDETEHIATFDIGLMPMPDTSWTRGKAALKALQYGAAAVPTVGSRTDTNEQILGSDDGALLCSADDDWRRALRTLADDPALRRELGRRARRRVEACFSLDVQAPRLVAAIRDGARDA